MKHGKACWLIPFLTLILVISSAYGFASKFTSAQPTTQPNPVDQELKQVISQEISLVPGAYRAGSIQLEINDRVAGQFVASNFYYYPNYYIGGHGEPVTYFVSVDFLDSQGQTVYNSSDREGAFSFTALYSGVYTIRCYCSDNIYLVKNPISPQLSINYTITGTPMEVNILSPLHQTYKESNTSLSYTVNRFGDWFGYSLDGGANLTLWDIDSGTPMSMGNTTLTGLSDGVHTLTVYVNDTYGSMDSKTVSFTVGTTDYLSLVTVTFVSAGLVCLAFAFYRRQRKRKTGAVAGI